MRLRLATCAFLLLPISLQAQQQLVLPDHHHLSENPNQIGNSGSTLWFRTTTSRFHLLYEAAAFTGAAAVSGPIVITKIKFRGEDGEINLGGQVYSNVTVAVGSTTLNTATLSTTFATNLAGGTTTMGPTGTTNITVAASQGSVPNNWNIEFDLLALGSSIVYDPSTGQSLLIDVNMPTAPTNAPPLGLIAFQNTTALPNPIRGLGMTSPGGASITGTSNNTPLVVGVEFQGAGGFTTIVPARNEFYGAACGGQAASFYEGFLNGQVFDLGGGLTMSPDNVSAPNYYIVSNGAPAPDTTKVNAAANLTLDDGVFTHPLGFTFNYPGGSTSTVVPSSNGFVWLDATMIDSAFAAVAARLLGDPVIPAPTPLPPAWNAARFAIFWKDLNMLRNVGLNPAAGLHAFTDTTGGAGNAVCYLTWLNIGEFNTVSGAGVNGHTNWTFQIVMSEASGTVEYRYGNVPAFATASSTTPGCFATLVGFSRGRIGGLLGVNSVDPQNRDISLEGTFTTAIEGAVGNMGQQAVALPNAGGTQYGGRLYSGQSVKWNAVNVPSGTIIAAQLLDVAANRPGFQFPTVTAPGCILSTSAGAILWETFLLPTATTAGTVPLVVPNGILGVDIYAQFVALDGLLGGPNLITVSSNAIKHTVGLN